MEFRQCCKRFVGVLVLGRLEKFLRVRGEGDVREWLWERRNKKIGGY